MPGSAARLSTRDLMSALLVILLWGLNFVPTKFALTEFTPFQLGAARFLLAAFPLMLFVSLPKVPIKWLLLYSVTQGVGQYGLLFFALKLGMTAALCSVMMQTQIFITALLGVTLLGETIPRALKVGMVMAGLGLGCFAINVFSSGAGVSANIAAFAIILIAASMWASSNIVVKRIQTAGYAYSPLSLVVWSSLITGVCFSLMSLTIDPPTARWDWMDAPLSVWLAALYLGWGGSALAFWLWTVLLTKHPASRVAPFSLGIPVIGLLSGIFILDEEVSALQWTGSLLVMSALVFVVFSSHRYRERMLQRYRNRG